MKSKKQIKNYFENLPLWNGIDHIQTLADTVKVTNLNGYPVSHKVWAEYLKQWLITSAGNAINFYNDKRLADHYKLIITGKQGIGKTKWGIALIPFQLADFLSSSIIHDDCDVNTIKGYKHVFECISFNCNHNIAIENIWAQAKALISSEIEVI